MILYIGRLPADITADKLRAALPHPRTEPWRLRLCKRIQADGSLIRYALYHPVSNEAALRLLRKRRVRIEGRDFTVREFQPRRVENERRAPGRLRRHWQGPERRRGDRRQGQPLTSVA